MAFLDNLISTSILSADFSELANQIKECEQAGTDWIHIDVMDGHFVPNITMGPFIVETCKRITQLPLDVHLMIEKPELHLDAFASAGADRITVQVETCPNLNRTLSAIHQLGCKAGVAINPGTPVDSLREVVYFLDLVLVMTVNPGYSGQRFIPQSVDKIQRVRQILDLYNPEALLQVDGGINHTNIHLVYQAGARVFVAANAIFSHPDGIAAGIKSLRDSINKE
jgi:ribulose-phosphate 3-epimerase